MPACQAYPTLEAPEPKPLPKRFRLSVTGEAGDVFEAFIAKLPGDAQSQRSAKPDGKPTAIHPVGDESLRMQCIGHVDAIPPSVLKGTVDDVSNCRGWRGRMIGRNQTESAI